MSGYLTRLPAPIRQGLKSTAMIALKSRDRLRGTQPVYLLILGHMRAGSTLLAHLLMNHPHISGIGERNQPYTTTRDFDRLQVDIAYYGRQWQTTPYLLDQINHTRFFCKPTLLNHPQVRLIFLIREPQAALASMVAVLGKHYGMTTAEAVAYYEERLTALTGMAGSVSHPNRLFFLTYADLTENSQTTLTKLTRFLGINPPLSGHYQAYTFTGQRGDPSANIHAGRILPNKNKHHLDLPPETLNAVQSVYDNCYRCLSDQAKREYIDGP